jgi:hypothetical protein
VSRSRFLPVFFVFLSIAFVIALVLRLRSDLRQQTIAGPQTPQPPAATETPTSQPPEAVTPARHERRETAAGSRLPVGASRLPEPRPSGNRQPATGNAPRRAVAQPAQQPKSMMARVLAPIAQALGVSPSPPKPAQPQSAPQSSSTASNTAQKSEAKDPNSDTTPPQLISVEFSPPQVEDGEQTTVIVTATDDLSGIRGVSGTISSPTGKALQGFATAHEGDSNRYIGHIAIAKNAEQGLWKVSFINMSDNASNSVTLSYAQGTVPPNAVLRVVSSNSDNTPPTLKNIWVDKRAVHGGEKDIIFVEAEDDKSGVNLVSAVFQSPSKLARIGAGCTHGEGDVWQCELLVPSCIDCGDWQLEQVTLQDKANNLATFRQDNPLIAATRINISGSACDNTPPVLQSVALDPNDVGIGDRGAVITVTIVATDDNCGVAGVSGQYVGPGPGSGGFFPFMQSGDSGTYIGRITLDPRSARGIWRINSIQLNDKGHNLRVYYATDPLLANATFHVR